MIAPPTIHIYGRAPMKADGENIKPGDKWIDTTNSHIYFIYDMPWVSNKFFKMARLPLLG